MRAAQRVIAGLAVSMALLALSWVDMRFGPVEEGDAGGGPLDLGRRRVGWALYAEWTTDAAEWAELGKAGA